MKIYEKIILISSVIGYGLFISFARIILGGHYSSDVLFSTGIASVLTILFYKKVYSEEIEFSEKIEVIKTVHLVEGERLITKNIVIKDNIEILEQTDISTRSRDIINKAKTSS